MSKPGFIRGAGGNIIANDKGQPMITVNIRRIAKELDKAYQLNIDGDLVWLPKSLVCIEKEKMKVAIPDWLYKEKFPKG